MKFALINATANLFPTKRHAFIGHKPLIYRHRYNLEGVDVLLATNWLSC